LLKYHKTFLYFYDTLKEKLFFFPNLWLLMLLMLLLLLLLLLDESKNFKAHPHWRLCVFVCVGVIDEDYEWFPQSESGEGP